MIIVEIRLAFAEDGVLEGIVKACPHCRRKVRLSPNSATVAVVSPFSATVALFGDSVDRALRNITQNLIKRMRHTQSAVCDRSKPGTK